MIKRNGKWLPSAADALSALTTPKKRKPVKRKAKVRRKTQTELSGTFLCESEYFNGPICQRQCARCAHMGEMRRIIAGKR